MNIRATMRRFLLALPVLATLALATAPARAAELAVEPSVDGKGIQIHARPAKAARCLIELTDGAGNVVKTVHAGRIDPGQSFVVQASSNVPPGAYKVRLRSGVDLKVIDEFKRPDGDGKWLNPTHLAIVGQLVYVLESGQPVAEPEEFRAWTATGAAPVEARFVSLVEGVVNVALKDKSAAAIKLDTLPAADQELAKKLEAERQARLPVRAAKATFIYKMDRQGRLDTSFGTNGRMVLGETYGLRAFAVDPLTGFLYLGWGHDVAVFDASGNKTQQTIGGWDGNPAGDKCTVWVSAVAIGPNNRIHIPGGGYGFSRLYDRTKNAFDGILATGKLPGYEGSGQYVACDLTTGAAYYTGRDSVLDKFVEDAKGYGSIYKSADHKVAKGGGLFANAGLVWMAARGPGFGPYWDSGGGGEVVLFHDSGTSLDLVGRWGTPGTGADRMEFMNPASTAMTPDHKELWVAEDGLTNEDGPPGNARIRRFAIQAEATEEVVVQLKR